MVTAPFCSPLHMVGVPLVESNNATVTTTFVPAACAARMKPGTGPFASFHVFHADPPRVCRRPAPRSGLTQPEPGSPAARGPVPGPERARNAAAIGET